MSEYSESCGVTGLEIKQGDAVRMLLLDKDRCSGPGPTNVYGVAAPPIRAVYDGRGGAEVVLAEPRDALGLEIIQRLAGLITPRDLTFKPGKLADKEMWLVGEVTFNFLADLPLQQPEQNAATVGQLADTRYKTIREAVTPHVADETAGRSGDSHAAFKSWNQLRIDLPGCVSCSYHMDEFAGSMERAEALMLGERDMFVICRAMYETRRVLAPSVRAGLEQAGHEAVGALARFTRRKAIHAGFEPA